MVRVRWLLGLLVVMFLVAGTSVSADDDKKADEPTQPAAKGTLPAGWRRLGLTDDQVKKVYRIQTEYRNKIDVLQQKIASLKKEERGEMEKILTEAQKTRLKELKDGGTTTTTPPAGEKKP